MFAWKEVTINRTNKNKISNGKGIANVISIQNYKRIDHARKFPPIVDINHFHIHLLKCWHQNQIFLCRKVQWVCSQSKLVNTPAMWMKQLPHKNLPRATIFMVWDNEGYVLPPVIWSFIYPTSRPWPRPLPPKTSYLVEAAISLSLFSPDGLRRRKD